jgi:hypothetical protein
MRRVAFFLAAVCLVLTLPAATAGRDRETPRPRFYRPNYVDTDIDIPGYREMPGIVPASAAAADTYTVIWYDFEQMNWQGWTRVDNTAPADTFFHVDDFAGLGGGTYGRLVPIEGTKSIWCGARPASSPGWYTCNWGSAPGYGNNWDEYIGTGFYHEPGNTVNVSYHLVCDTESESDLVTFEWSTDGGCCGPCAEYIDWEVVETYSGVVDTVVTHSVFSLRHGTKLRFRFVSDGAFSDEDGAVDTDGACIIDSITVWDDNGLIDFEDFESCAVGESNRFGIWETCVRYPYGRYSGLANNLVDKDPCNVNFGSIITFFHGSPFPDPDYPWPGLFSTPFCTGTGGKEKPCQDEMVVSPPIDLTRYSTNSDEVQDAEIPPGDLGDLTGLYLRYAAYVDLPLSNLVLRTWYVRDYGEDCPGEWRTESFWIPYEPYREWVQENEDISRLVSSDTIQVALGVVDMCYAWYGLYGDCEEHTPAPWYDNVRIDRYKAANPAWSVRRGELFQDTFPQEVEGSPDPMEEFCRADMAVDVAPGDDVGRIDPGDSAVVRVYAAPGDGLDTLVTGEERVYCHVNVTYIGGDPQKPDLTGSQLEGNYGSYAGDDGDWTMLLCEPAYYSSGHAAENAFCIDLDDSLFTRGYMIEYYFKAYALSGASSTYPAGAETMPPSPFPYTSSLLEFTCLPTLRTVPGILYVDDFDDRGVHNGVCHLYYDWSFDYITATSDDLPDRYDVNQPSSALSNGIGAYLYGAGAASIFSQAYGTVIFDSGDLSWCTISEGTLDSDKSDDALLLVDWLNTAENDVGLLVMGDMIASDLASSQTAVAVELVSTICGASLSGGSYLDLTGGLEHGGIVSPLITGVASGPYDGLSYWARGGCPLLSDFDALEKVGPGEYALQYPDYGEDPYYAGIYTNQVNPSGYDLRTVWVGHSFQNIRNAMLGPPARNSFLDMTWDFFERPVHTSEPMADAEIPKATSLSNNFPNPFNPVTRISFALKEKGPVSLRVYDVSGRLVKVLVEEVRGAGFYETSWDGTNDSGRQAASGIYFCRMTATGYERTQKMVMLR